MVFLSWRLCLSYQLIALQLQIHFVDCSEKKELGPLNNFSLPDGTMLSSVSRECLRDIAREKKKNAFYSGLFPKEALAVPVASEAPGSCHAW